MTPEQIQRNRNFIRDLRANERKAKGIMRDSDGGRCCLCVALDTATADGFCDWRWDDDGILPPLALADWYGWPEVSCIATNPTLSGVKASAHNDGSGSTAEKTHAEIADLFEKEFNL